MTQTPQINNKSSQEEAEQMRNQPYIGLNRHESALYQDERADMSVHW